MWFIISMVYMNTLAGTIQKYLYIVKFTMTNPLVNPIPKEN